MKQNKQVENGERNASKLEPLRNSGLIRNFFSQDHLLKIPHGKTSILIWDHLLVRGKN